MALWRPRGRRSVALFYERGRDGRVDPHEKKLSAREALAAHLKQIERVNPQVNAIVTLVAEMAADDAAKADEMQARHQTLGPLHGLPVAHKDLLETRASALPLGHHFIRTTSRLKTILW